MSGSGLTFAVRAGQGAVVLPCDGLPVTDPLYLTIRDIVADVTAVDPDSLTPESADLFPDEESFFEVYERASAATGVPFGQIHASLPLYRFKVGETTMSSLRNLAALSARARARLAHVDVRLETETLASLVETFRTGRYVSSGLLQPPLNPPRSRRYVLFWTLALLLGPVAIAAGLTLLPCNSLRNDCWSPPAERFRAFLFWPTLICAGLLALAWLPGLLDLWRAARREARRAAARRRRGG